LHLSGITLGVSKDQRVFVGELVNERPDFGVELKRLEIDAVILKPVSPYDVALAGTAFPREDVVDGLSNPAAIRVAIAPITIQPEA
jgi:hypothetical protein